MPKYNVTVEFNVMTEIEPEFGRYTFDRSGLQLTEYEDSSYFSPEPITVYGGNITFTLDADSEDAAQLMAEDVISDGMEIEDDNNLTWSIDGTSIEIEAQEEPMDMAQATEIITRFLLASTLVPEEVKEAVRFLLDHVKDRESQTSIA